MLEASVTPLNFSISDFITIISVIIGLIESGLIFWRTQKMKSVHIIETRNELKRTVSALLFTIQLKEINPLKEETCHFAAFDISDIRKLISATARKHKVSIDELGGNFGSIKTTLEDCWLDIATNDYIACEKKELLLLAIHRLYKDAIRMKKEFNDKKLEPKSPKVTRVEESISIFFPVATLAVAITLFIIPNLTGLVQPLATSTTLLMMTFSIITITFIIFVNQTIQNKPKINFDAEILFNQKDLPPMPQCPKLIKPADQRKPKLKAYPIPTKKNKKK